MIEDLVIREFKFPTDYSAVIHLWQTAGAGIHVGRSDSPDEIEKKLNRDPDLFLVAETNQTIIATVLGGFDGRRGIVYHLAVAQQFRRQGIASKLMDELEKRLKEKGCIRVYLLLVNGNQEAFEFYKNQGWETLDVAVLGKYIG